MYCRATRARSFGLSGVYTTTRRTSRRERKRTRRTRSRAHRSRTSSPIRNQWRSKPRPFRPQRPIFTRSDSTYSRCQTTGNNRNADRPNSRPVFSSTTVRWRTPPLLRSSRRRCRPSSRLRCSSNNSSRLRRNSTISRLPCTVLSGSSSRRLTLHSSNSSRTQTPR